MPCAYLQNLRLSSAFHLISTPLLPPPGDQTPSVLYPLSTLRAGGTCLLSHLMTETSEGTCLPASGGSRKKRKPQTVAASYCQHWRLPSICIELNPSSVQHDETSRLAFNWHGCQCIGYLILLCSLKGFIVVDITGGIFKRISLAIIKANLHISQRFAHLVLYHRPAYSCRDGSVKHLDTYQVCSIVSWASIAE